ncbi:MAG: hypothetical protein M3N53_13105 [Actinomycetota bacterium]|nr:hypothetical protein [Actinomycetota bacterium]
MSKPTRKQVELGAAFLAGAAAIALAVAGRWVFAPSDIQADASVWDVIIADRTTLGFLRLALLMLGLFTVVSIPALMVAGRWIKGFSASGLTADDAKDAELALKDLRDQHDRVKKQRDELLTLLDEVTSPPHEEAGGTS